MDMKYKVLDVDERQSFGGYEIKSLDAGERQFTCWR